MPDHFHGSYAPEDVIFLLKPLKSVANLPPEEKERAMQTGKKHYSEMLTPETLPSAPYLRLFQDALAANGAKMAADCEALATLILQETRCPVLVSLARAGTPVGVIVKHLLSEKLQRDVAHYSISIIRDRGIDHNALRTILNNENTRGENLIFIDGWTGKGVINRELCAAVQAFNARHQTSVPDKLYVLSDLAGVAWRSASYEDYLIPSAILNATVSGLVSRSVLNEQIGANDYHGCLFYQQFLPHDQSRHFAQTILDLAQKMPVNPAASPADLREKMRTEMRTKMTAFMRAECARYGINDINLIKPGIGEATRVLLRRVPERVIVRQPEGADVRHLLTLAAEKNVPVETRAELPFSAVSIIRSAKI